MPDYNDSHLTIFHQNHDLTFNGINGFSHLEGSATSSRILPNNIFNNLKENISNLLNSNQSESNKIDLVPEANIDLSSSTEESFISQIHQEQFQFQDISAYIKNMVAEQNQPPESDFHPQQSLDELVGKKGMSVVNTHQLSNNVNNEATIPNKPNIVLIMADDLGYEGIGAYGGTSYSTPVIDRLAQTGVRFNHAYSQPACTPSRVQLMTGLYNQRNYTEFADLDRNQTTFAQILQQEGYATAIAGKWQLGGEQDSPQHFGFDQSLLSLQEDTLHPVDPSFRNPELTLNGTKINYTNGEYGPDLASDFIVEFIENNKDKPFFAYYPMMLTHKPIEPTPDSADWNQPLTDLKYFADNVNYMDKMVGKIIKKLNELQLRKNTLVIFTSDNGTVRDIVSTINGQQVRGGKNSTTDAGTHVPLIASWSGVIPQGSVRNDLVDFSDFFPTFIDVADATLPANLQLDGRSFLPQLQGQNGNPRQWSYGFWSKGTVKQVQRNGLQTFEWVRNQNYKLYANGEFYNIKNDPLETNPLNNLAPRQQQLRNLFKNVLYQYGRYPNNIGNHLSNRMNGDTNHNRIIGREGNDTIIGGLGNDTLYGNSGDDRLIAGPGNDWLMGNGDDDLLVGGLGNDYFHGGLGSDRLRGDNGLDTLTGGAGNDILIGGNGNDTLTGNWGKDLFRYDSYHQGTDKITDYSIAHDSIIITRSGFGGGLPLGTLHQNQFAFGFSARTPEHRFLYSRATGDLFYDRDGTGPLAQQHIATLSPDLPLTRQEFIVI